MASGSYDRAEIRRALAQLVDPGDVVELRALDVSTSRYARLYTVSGYFTDLGKLEEAAARVQHAKGIYITLNLVHPDLLARAANRLRPAERNLSTGDDHILRRRWFPIDCDPVRPSGICATDAEHEAALTRAYEIRDVLREAGWPDPMTADGGNSGHLLYAIDLPNDADSRALLQRCLEALAFRCDDERVVVDTSVFNAARIWRLYGTMNRKGDDIPDRPHRLTRLLTVPERITPVPRELLEALARSARQPEEPRLVGRAGNGQPFEIEQWIATHGLDVSGPCPWGKGRKWIFPVCPWNTDHRNRSAYIVENVSGAIAAGCHHNGCHGKDWPALRDLVEPGWQEPRGTPHGGHVQERSAGEDNPWEYIKDAPTFLAEPQPEFEGLAKELLAPGAITMLAAPRGLGKMQVAHSLAVALATAGVFRGERVKGVRVLLLDRDNPEYIIRQRLQAWGGEVAKNLFVLTRQYAPSLRKQAAWMKFPLDYYDVVIMDAVGSFTEGITEREGKQTTEVLATIVDLARKGLAVLLLQNATKDGLNFKGREEWADRVDVIYELRDATDFVPSLKKPWWEELPEAHEGAWAARAARRKGRCDFRLAFIPSKYRLGPEPEPFCLELHLPAGALWTVADVTQTLIQAAEQVKKEADEQHVRHQEDAALALLEVVKERATGRNPILKTEAENILCKEYELKRKDARMLIASKTGHFWRIEARPQGRGKGNAQSLVPLVAPSDIPPSDGEQTDNRSVMPDKGEEPSLSAARSQTERQTILARSRWGTRKSEPDFVGRDSALIEDAPSADTTLDGWEEGVI